MFSRGIILLECDILCLQRDIFFWSVIYYACKGNYSFGCDILCCQDELLLLNVIYCVCIRNYFCGV